MKDLAFMVSIYFSVCSLVHLLVFCLCLLSVSLALCCMISQSFPYSYGLVSFELARRVSVDKLHHVVAVKEVGKLEELLVGQIAEHARLT